jgi:hypothetical protein
VKKGEVKNLVGLFLLEIMRLLTFKIIDYYKPLPKYIFVVSVNVLMFEPVYRKSIAT